MNLELLVRFNGSDVFIVTGVNFYLTLSKCFTYL